MVWSEWCGLGRPGGLVWVLWVVCGRLGWSGWSGGFKSALTEAEAGSEPWGGLGASTNLWGCLGGLKPGVDWLV